MFIIFGMFTFNIFIVDTRITEQSIHDTIMLIIGIPIMSMNMMSSPTVISFTLYFGPSSVLPIRYILMISNSIVTGIDIRYAISVMCTVFIFVTDDYFTNMFYRLIPSPPNPLWLLSCCYLSTYRYPLDLW